jgi:hypothetical protein
MGCARRAEINEGGPRRCPFWGARAASHASDGTLAIAASVGRHKDLARIEQLLELVKIDKALLDDILGRYNLKLPKK